MPLRRRRLSRHGHGAGGEPLILSWALLAVVAAFTWASLRGGWRPTSAVHGGSSGILLALVAVVVAVLFFGISGGIALILSVAVHEYGHVAAFRVAGHPDARFRLIPLVGGVAISNKKPATPAHDLFITIMGPGICLVLMAGAWMGANTIGQNQALVAEFLIQLATFTAMLNFFNLWPIYPLDGGRIAALTLGSFAPRQTQGALMAVSLAGVAYSIFTLSLFLMLCALISFKAAKDLDQTDELHHRLAPGTAITGLLAWAAMTAAFALGGGTLIFGFLGF